MWRKAHGQNCTDRGYPDRTTAGNTKGIRTLKEPSQEVRTILAIVLSLAVILAWGYFFRPKLTPPVEQPGAQKTIAGSPASAPGQAGQTPAGSAASSSPSPTAASAGVPDAAP